MAKAPKKTETDQGGTMTDDDSPIGMTAGGEINVVDPDSPPWRPKVVDKDGNEVDPDTIEDDESGDE